MEHPLSRGGLFYGWLVVAAAFWAMIAIFGTYYSFGVFFKPMASELGWSRGATSGAIALMLVIHGASYILVGWLIDRYSPQKVIALFSSVSFLGYVLLSQTHALWQLYFFYGVVVAVGYGCGYAPFAVLVTRWFQERRGLALGIAAAGIGVGTIVVPPLASYLIHLVGWRGAFPIIGFLLWGLMLLASLVIRGYPREKGLQPYGYKEATQSGLGSTAVLRSARPEGLTLSQALVSPTMWQLCAVFAFFGVANQMVMFHIVNYATDIGIAPLAAAGVLSFIGIGSTGGRILMGAFSDRFGRQLTLALCLATLTVMTLLFTAMKDLGWLYFGGIIFGLSYGGAVPQQAALTGEIFGLRSLGVILGLAIFGATLGGAMGPVLAGYVFDVTTSYRYAFIGGAAMAALATTLAVLLRRPQRGEREEVR